ncbi:MAG: PaaI family thioesterase [Rhodospirillales bacterium]|nr:PaaI family thioesterase [Rhodospirillales bacterium]
MTDEKNTKTRTYEWECPNANAASGHDLTGLEFLRALIDGKIPAPPMARTMDFRLDTVGEGLAVFRSTPAEFHYNPIGTVHGGYLGTLLDSAMGCAVHTTLKAGEGYTTLEFKVNLVRPMTAETGPIRCEGRILHRGSRMATAEGRVIDEAGKVFAHGSTTCMIFETWGHRERSKKA